MNKRLLRKWMVLLFVCAATTGFAQTKYQKDFMEFWTDIRNDYAYLDQQQVNWQKVREIYEPQAAKITTDQAFIGFLESVLNELYNGHSSLNTNLPSSNRLVPSGTDLYVEKAGNRYFIRDLRKGFGADLSGLKIGMEVIRFNGEPVEPQLKKFLPKFTDTPSPKMYRYALDMLFAGTHNTPRAITVLDSGQEKTFRPITYGNRNELLYHKVLNKNTAYIKINNSLGNYDLVAAFDQTLDSLLQYKNLVLDLTETPGGGNSTVARAIMGRFIDQQLPYQVHELDEKAYDTKRHWIEYVTPRKERFKGKLYVLVGHWTGSMGEGMAIGFDGMKRAQLIGTAMAGLIGAVSNYRLTETGIGYQFPTERLYHVNGTPRENFLPGIRTQHMEETIQKAKAIQ
jgi:carboxyl-terminal processing protease